MDLGTLCLGILSQGDTTGYALEKQLEQGYGHNYAAGFGSIYPALARLWCSRPRADLIRTFLPVTTIIAPSRIAAPWRAIRLRMAAASSAAVNPSRRTMQG